MFDNFTIGRQIHERICSIFRGQKCLENHLKIDFTKKATQISRFLTHHLLILAKVDYDLFSAS